MHTILVTTGCWMMDFEYYILVAFLDAACGPPGSLHINILCDLTVSGRNKLIPYMFMKAG